MTKQKSTKRALLMSGIALLMCVSMLIGSTYAWFTDTASTAVNKIQSGTLDVALEMLVGGEWVDAEGETLSFKAADDRTEILWEPGCTYELPVLRIVNKGNLALKYKVIITGIDGDAKLNEAIDWYYSVDLSSLIPGATGWTTPSDLYKLENFGEEDYLLPEGHAANARTHESVFKIIGKMKEDAGNEYQNLTIENIGITVVATQYTYEYDSKDNQYDKDATFPSVWDGTIGEVPEANASNEMHITSAADLAAIMAATTTGNSNSLYVGKTLVLDRDIDFGGRTISGIGGYNDNVVFTFDGNGHTISNFVINGKDDAHKEINEDGKTEYRYAGLFQQFNGTVKDLTVRNATIIGDQMVGVIAANVDNSGKIENCKVYDSIVIGAKKVGAIAGYIAGTNCTITGCYAENVDVYASDSREEQSAEMVGYEGAGAVIDNKEPVNVNVHRGVANPVLVSTAAELAALNTKTGMQNIIITNDIDMSAYADRKGLLGGTEGHAFVSSGVTIYGNGHTISSLSSALIEATTYPVTIKGLTIADSTIADNNKSGVGVFVSYSDASSVTLEDCHAVNCKINTERDTRIAALVGWASSTLSIKDCSAIKCELKAHGSIGAAFGHCSGASEITNITVKDCKFTSIDEGGWRVGQIIGTADTATHIIDGYTVSNNTLEQTDKTAPAGDNLFGREVNGGTVTVK